MYYSDIIYYLNTSEISLVFAVRFLITWNPLALCKSRQLLSMQQYGLGCVLIFFTTAESVDQLRIHTQGCNIVFILICLQPLLPWLYIKLHKAEHINVVYDSDIYRYMCTRIQSEFNKIVNIERIQDIGLCTSGDITLN